MTAHDVPVARSWAVIDRPYNSDASRFQLPVGPIMISPTRLFCRVRSGHLKLSAPDGASAECQSNTTGSRPWLKFYRRYAAKTGQSPGGLLLKVARYPHPKSLDVDMSRKDT